MKNIFDDIFDEAESLKDINVNTSKDLSVLVKSLRDTEARLSDAEELVSQLKKEKHKLSTEQIPQLMDEMGVKEFKTDDGVSISNNVIIHASIPVDKRDEAYAWLRDNRCDDIIKNDVILSFTKGEDNVAGDITERLKSDGFDPIRKNHIHPATLKKFVKDCLERNVDINLDMFGAFVQNVAKIGRK
jgi:hypothetical protein